MNYFLIFYIALPAFAANMAPVFAARFGWFKSLGKPIDGNIKLRDKPLLGQNKTWRGLVVGVIASICISIIQYTLSILEIIPAPHLPNILLTLFFGTLAGLGVIFGDAFESFIKRQFGIKSGRPFIPFDQIDYIFGYFLFTWLLVDWQLRDIIFLLIIAALLNPLSNVIGYLLKIKNTYW